MNLFYYLTGRTEGLIVQDAVREELTKKLDAKVAVKIDKSTKQLAPIEAKLKSLHKTAPTTVVSFPNNEDATGAIIRKRAEASKRAAEQRQKQTLDRLAEERDARLMRLASSVRRLERKSDALYHDYALGVAKQRSRRAKAEPTTFKSEAYVEFVSSLTSKEGKE